MEQGEEELLDLAERMLAETFPSVAELAPQAILVLGVLVWQRKVLAASTVAVEA